MVEFGLIEAIQSNYPPSSLEFQGLGASTAGAHPADLPSGAGAAGAVEPIAGRVRSAHQVRCRAIGSAAEQKGQHVDRIGDVDGTVIIVVACIRASDGPAPGEENCEVEDGIGQVSGGV